MGRRRVPFILAGALLLVLCLPAVASAGQLSWDMPANFTASAPGANPDHDSYGGMPWSYREGPVCEMTPVIGGCTSPPSTDPTHSTALANFVTPGTSSGWTDASDQQAFVGVDSTLAGQLVVIPPADRAVVVEWTSPLGHSATVSVSDTVTAAFGIPCFSSSLYHGSRLLSPGSVAVAPGDSISVVITPAGPAYSPACATADVQLRISSAASAPFVTLDSPSAGSVLTNSQPKFTGAAVSGYGISSTVTVRVYRGSSASGAPVETLTTTAGPAGRYTVGRYPLLSDGTYTAQAEQDNLASPPGASLSRAVTFGVANASPTIRLSSPAGSFNTGTPTFTGTAGTSSRDGRSVGLIVYAGLGTATTPIGFSFGMVGPNGRFSVQAAPPLGDGQYTAIAVQTRNGANAFSNPVRFRVKLHASTLTIATPAPGGAVSSMRPPFSGAAGVAVGDTPVVSVTLHAGNSPTGRSLGHRQVPVTHATWSLRWPSQLSLGVYTLVVVQGDDAGHTTTVATTFRIVPALSAIGSHVTISGAQVQVPVSCTARSGTTCRGTVLTVSTVALQTRPGGPVGPVRVLFAYVQIAGGHTQVVRASLPSYVVAALHRVRHLRVRVTVSLSGMGHSSAIRSVG